MNDADGQAMQLSDLLEGFRAHVNLIPYNPIGSGLSSVVYRRPSLESVTASSASSGTAASSRVPAPAATTSTPPADSSAR